MRPSIRAIAAGRCSIRTGTWAGSTKRSWGKHGNVIGINTAIVGNQGNVGIGFAMPISRAKAMLDEFQKNGHISRPTLGIRTMYIVGDLAEELHLPATGGLLIQSVEDGSPARDSGLRGPQSVVIAGNYR